MAYYDFVSNAQAKVEVNAIRVAKSSHTQTTSTENPMPINSVNSTYVSNNGNKAQFKKACKILIHYEVASVGYSNGVSMVLYKEGNPLSAAIEAENGQYKNGSFITTVAQGDKIHGYATVATGDSGSIAHYTIYVLTAE